MGARLQIDHVRGLNGEETTSVCLAFHGDCEVELAPKACGEN